MRKRIFEIVGHRNSKPMLNSFWLENYLSRSLSWIAWSISCDFDIINCNATSYNDVLYVFCALAVGAIGSKPERVPFVSCSCHVCHTLPCWHRCHPFTLHALLVEGMLLLSFAHQSFSSKFNFLLTCVSAVKQLNLFTTLKALGFLGAFLVFVGHRTLSYLASSSAKLKSSWDDVEKSYIGRLGFNFVGINSLEETCSKDHKCSNKSSAAAQLQSYLVFF